ncbi:threonine/serine exporter family protein [Rhodopseudomonas sp. B29]|uniref:threonine/serine exporter family protein n=1 Tax=Rhodopseudomonas sp. B29 TaxID=95607 RepID=UPI0003469C16|nr:threonine/serine exporter family protein [Rhodopseudomonas sp. B29]
MDQPTPPAEPAADHRQHQMLERIAHVALRIGTTLAQSGASVRVVHEGARLVTSGLGAEVLGMRSGYASFEITVAMGPLTTTRMMQIGPHGVNHRLDFAVRDLAVRASQGGMTPEEISAELLRLVQETPRHPPWLVAVATGLACAAFGRLLGADWPSFVPTLLAAGLGQRIRHALLAHHTNVFVVAGIVGYFAAALGCIGARLAGSSTVELAMMASTLLLVPGVPSTNAQTDIMDGYPTMGSARAITVIMIMVFAVTGVWLAEFLLRIHA